MITNLVPGTLYVVYGLNEPDSFDGLYGELGGAYWFNIKNNQKLLDNDLVIFVEYCGQFKENSRFLFKGNMIVVEDIRYKQARLLHHLKEI